MYVMELKRGRRPGPLHDSEKSSKAAKSEKRQTASSSSSSRAAKQKQNTVKPAVSSLPGLSMFPPVVSRSIPGFGMMNPLFNSLGGVGIRMPMPPSPMVWGGNGLTPSYPWMMPPSASPVVPPTSALLSAPLLYERRVIRTLFALYKHHHLSAKVGDKERQAWFEIRFSKLLNSMRRHSGGASVEEFSLIKWLAQQQIRVDPMIDVQPVDALLMKHGPNFDQLPVDEDPAPMQDAGLRLGTINVFSDMQVECDDDFVRSLGYDTKSLIGTQSWLVPGYLPWGAEVIARLAKSDRDAVRYIQRLAKAFARARPDASGVLRAQAEMPLFIKHASGIDVRCNLISDVIESSTPTGLLLQGVSLHFFLNVGGGAQDAAVAASESSTDPLSSSLLGPWPNMYSGANWLEPTLQWVDGEASQNE